MESYGVSAKLNRLMQLNDVSEEAISLIRSILLNVQRLDPQESQRFIDALDKAADALRSDTNIYQEFLFALRKICGSKGILPSTHILPQGLTKSGAAPSAYGGFADVWEGIYKNRRTAIKVLRVCGGVKRVDLNKLSHPNIVPFLGVSDEFPPLCIVSEWMPYGNMAMYVASYPDANRPQLLVDICKGLQFLHSLEIVHGDLKGQNILINSDGEACLGDFGLTSVICHLSTVDASTTVSGLRGTCRWMAPELFDTESNIPGSGHSTASDIYALAMVIIELFSGKVPFPGFLDVTVIFKVVNGERPCRPPSSLRLGLCDDMWNLVQSCWEHDQGKRPDISFVLNRLRAIAPGISLLERLKDFDSNSASSIGILQSLLDSRIDEVLAGDPNITKFTEVLDQAMESTYMDVELRKKGASALTTLYSHTGILPASYRISDLKKTHDRPNVLGAHSDIWEGICDGHAVAIKVFRISRFDKVEAIRKRIFEQAATWKQLPYPNIVRFFGISSTPLPCIVCQWMMHGQLTQYLTSNPDANRLQLMVDVASGLEYLHSRNIVHGELKAAHVLINGAKLACLTGFLPETMIDGRTSSKFGVDSHGAWRWMAPEVLDPRMVGLENDGPSSASDVYAFAMVFIEAFTGKLPFHELDNDVATIPRIIVGARPQRPEDAFRFGLTDDIWQLIQRCWRLKVKRRPTISSVLQTLQNMPENDSPVDIDTSWSMDRTCKIRCRSRRSSFSEQSQQGNTRLIAVMGRPGNFSLINLISGSNIRVRVGSKPNNYFKASEPFNLCGQQARLIDIPSFNNTREADADILKRISTFLANEYAEGRKLSGVLYMHRINDSICRKNFAMLQKLCGADAFQNVTIVTSGWNDIDPAIAEAREEKLKTDPRLFKYILDRGARLMRYDGTRSSANDIALSLGENRPIALLVQVEMMDEKKEISETSAGLELLRGFAKQMEPIDEELQDLSERLEAIELYFEDARRALTDEVTRLQEEKKKLLGDRQFAGSKVSEDASSSSSAPSRSSSNLPMTPSQEEEKKQMGNRTYLGRVDSKDSFPHQTMLNPASIDLVMTRLREEEMKTQDDQDHVSGDGSVPCYLIQNPSSTNLLPTGLIKEEGRSIGDVQEDSSYSLVEYPSTGNHLTRRLQNTERNSGRDRHLGRKGDSGVERTRSLSRTSSVESLAKLNNLSRMGKKKIGSLLRSSQRGP